VNAYLIRRVLLGIPTIFMTVLIIFFMMRILPGDVAETMLIGGSSGGSGVSVPQETIDALKKQMGLDKPLHMEFLTFVWNTLRGDFGDSLYTGQSVWSEIKARAPVTLQIALIAKVLAIVLGVPIGILAAIKQDSMPDYLLRFWTITFLAIPSFWMALLVLLVGGLYFNWMPPVGAHPLWEEPVTSLKQTMWPAIILASHSMAVFGRMTRSTMLEVMREDYIRTARSKGLSEKVVIARHALKNALIPVVTMIGLTLGGLMSGTVVLERVFTIPGLGTLFINSINWQDYPVVQAMVFMVALTFVVVNIFVDVLYGWLDPRISYGTT